MKKNFLSNKERKEVDRVLDSNESSLQYRRALILKMVDEGYQQTEISKLRLSTTRTVHTLIKKLSAEGIAAVLHDKPRTGQPRKFNKKQEVHITAIACSDPPKGHARWSLSLLKQHSEEKKIIDSISKESLRIILVSQDIKPWRHKMWCIPTVDDAFIKQMEEVLAVYEKPYDPNEPVVCLDEKTIQLLDSERAALKIRGAAHQDYEYIRKGVVNAFCAIEPKAGKHFVLVRERKTMKDFALFVRKIITAYPNAKTVHLVMDNLASHKEKALIQTFGKKRGSALWKRITPHYSPKHASWLNQAEIEISMFSRTCIGKQRISDIQILEEKAAAWSKYMNKHKVKINWGFTRRKARAKFRYKTGKD